jgi:twitching motility protein PilT
MKNALEVVKKGVEMGASDIHVTVAMPPIFRINGELVVDQSAPLTGEDTRRIGLEIIPDAQFKEILDRSGQVDFSAAIPCVGRFRVNLYTQRGSYAAAIRVISAEIPLLEQLGLPEVVYQIAGMEKGLILVAGVAGNGRSTTMAAILNHINRTKHFHVLTIEDPIEYLHSHGTCVVNQREVGKDTVSYVQGLKAAMRQDPDMIVIGEMRDVDTIAAAVTAAETGHLVLSSVYSTDAVQSISRLVDIFPPGQKQQIIIQLAGSLQAIIAQQLIPRIDSSSRIPAVEVLLTNRMVRELIRKNEFDDILDIIEASGDAGMVSMDQALHRLYTEHKIAYAEAAKRICRHMLPEPGAVLNFYSAD